MIDKFAIGAVFGTILSVLVLRGFPKVWRDKDTLPLHVPSWYPYGEAFWRWNRRAIPIGAVGGIFFTIELWLLAADDAGLVPKQLILIGGAVFFAMAVLMIFVGLTGRPAFLIPPYMREHREVRLRLNSSEDLPDPEQIPPA
jgi:hypothetical protein